LKNNCSRFCSHISTFITFKCGAVFTYSKTESGSHKFVLCHY
jgi:hypothetical protein